MKRALLCWLLLSACAEPARVPVESAAGVDLLALLQLDDRGHVARATGLEPWDQARGLTLYTGTGPALIAGYASADLLALGASSAAFADPLMEAAGCQSRLPAPRLLARLEDGAALDPSMAPALTAAWIQATCPSVRPEELSFDAGCRQFSCAQAVTIDRCRFSVTLDCELGGFSGVLGADGSACLDAPFCESRVPEAPAIGSSRCTAPEECTIDIYRAPERPLFTADLKPVLDVPPYSPPIGLTGTVPGLPRSGRFIGYTHDLIVLPRAIVVSAGPGNVVEQCPGDVASVLHFFDPETMEQTRTATAPNCLMRLLPDDAGGFVGVFGRGDAWMLGRFDEDGRLDPHSEAPVDPRSPGPVGPNEPHLLRTHCHRPTGLLSRAGGVALVLDNSSEASECGEVSSAMFTFDASSFAPLARVEYPGRSLFAVAPDADDDRLVIAGDSAEIRVSRLDALDGTISDTVVIPRDITRNDRILPDVAPLAHGAVLSSVHRNDPSVYLLSRQSGITSRAVIYERLAGPVAAHAWGGDRVLVLATQRLSSMNWPAYAAIFDSGRSLFLPGIQQIGHGAAGPIREDASSRLWLLLPWEAKLVRLTRAD